MSRFVIADDISKKISLMAVICSFMVVFIHLPVPAKEMQGARMVYSFFSHGFCKIAVPFFFISAGYLLEEHYKKSSSYLNEVKKKSA